MTFSTKALVALSATVVASVLIVNYTSKKEREELEARRRRIRAREKAAAAQSQERKTA